MNEGGRPAWPSNGVQRVLGPAAPVAAELARRGWDVAVVPASTADAELWDGLVGALGLPDWFGRNLDALDEVFADLTRPTALVFSAWTAYALARPERWRGLLHVLRDSACRPEASLVVLLTD